MRVREGGREGGSEIEREGGSERLRNGDCERQRDRKVVLGKE